jgi:hypothetical protein
VNIGDFQPLYNANGTRDKARRYYDPSNPDKLISRRQFEQAQGGKTFEQKAKERKQEGTILSRGQSQYNRNLETYAKSTGKTIKQVRRDPEFMKLNKMYRSEMGKRGRALRRHGSYANDDVVVEIMKRLGRKRMDDYTALGGTPDLT